MKKILAVVLGLSLFIPGITFAQEQENEPKVIQAVEYFSGFGWGKLQATDNYNLIPLAVDFDFDLKQLTKKIGFAPSSLLQFQIEPYIAPVSSPRSNLEFGTSFFLKVGVLPQDSKFQPYFKFGTGISYMTLHTREQGNQFNFISSAGAGIHYALKKNTYLTLEGRYRHLSNCGLDKPNHGINTAFVLLGLSQQF